MNGAVRAYVLQYLADTGQSSWEGDTVDRVIVAEAGAQRKSCVVPVAHTVAVVTTMGSAVLTSDSTFSADDIGGSVTGVGIPDDTQIVDVLDTTATMSAAATADGAVNVTIDPDISDLIEALARRVSANLANRNLPLGVQTQVSEFGGLATRVGGSDREVERLEAPYRRFTIV